MNRNRGRGAVSREFFSNRPNTHVSNDGHRFEREEVVPRGPRNKRNTPKFSRNTDEPPREPLETRPQPKHLSKKDSEIKNDPLYCEAFCDEFGSSLRRDPDDPNILSTTEGLRYIEDALYKDYVAKSAGFANCMPSSALSYYLSVLTNARLVKIHLDNGYNGNYDAERFVHESRPADISIARALLATCLGLVIPRYPAVAN